MDKFLMNDLITLVESRIGLSIGAKDREAFGIRILARMKMRGDMDPRSYRGLLSSLTPEAFEEWQELVPLLTTGESYFFRDQGQHELLRNSILPRLLELRKEQKTLRIWSAGCATGEEPYSLAMLLDGLLPVCSRWQILILGTDINTRALEKARSGVFTQWSFRMVAPAVQSRYFTRRRDAWELDKKIRDMVTFRRNNLVVDQFPSGASELHAMDLILCRNVFIYFTPETVALIMEKFAGVLNEGGYLITGHGEVPRSALKWFKNQMLDGHVLYRKITDVDPKPAQPLDMRTASVPAAGDRTHPASKPHPERKLPGVSVSGPESKRHEPDPCETEFRKAQAFADAGRYEDALRVCRVVLESAPTFAPAYVLLAQLAESQGNLDEAQESLKRALFLKHDHVAACLELGRIYALKQDARRAEQMYTAATELLRVLPPGAAVETYRDVTAGELLRYLEEVRNRPPYHPKVTHPGLEGPKRRA